MPETNRPPTLSPAEASLPPTGSTEPETTTQAPRTRASHGPFGPGEAELLLTGVHDLPADERGRIYQRVVNAYLPFARGLASRYRFRGEPSEDLEQVASLGLVLAIVRFDPSKGATLADFAAPTITGELRKHFRDRCWLVRPPRRLQELRPRLREVQQELEQSLRRQPTLDEVADTLGVPVSTIAEIERAATGYEPVSLETPLGSAADAATLGEILPDAEDDLSRLVDQITVHSLLACLTDRQRRIVQLRYFQEKTQQEIADELGVSQVQVSRLLSQILARLREAAETVGEQCPNGDCSCEGNVSEHVRSPAIA